MKAEEGGDLKAVFPGYILVEMAMSEETWHVVRNTPKVTGFVSQGNKPTRSRRKRSIRSCTVSLRPTRSPKPKFMFDAGETVKIIDGPFSNFTGLVEDVNLERNTVKVMVTIFGRAHPG